MNNWTDFDELGAVLIAVLIIGGTVALYILSAVMPGEVFVPNELKAVAAAILAAYGFKIQKKTPDNRGLVKQSSENNSSK